jgi:hypothetical protein
MDEVPYSLEEPEPQAAPPTLEAEPAEVLSLPIEVSPDKDAPKAAPAPAELARFGPSHRALSQRRILAAGLVVLMLAGIFLALNMAALWGWGSWLLVAVFGFGLLLIARSAGSNPLAGREVLLHPQALELRRGAFRKAVEPAPGP